MNNISINRALSLGIQAFQVKDYHSADRYFTAILHSNPDHPDANHNLGVLAITGGDYVKAISFLEKWWFGGQIYYVK